MSAVARLLALPAEMWRERIFYLFVMPFAGLVIIFGLWPIVESIGVAFTDSFTALSPTPRYVGFANFAKVLTDPDFLDSLRITLVYTAVSVVANVGFALLYALLLDSPALRNSNTLFRLAVFLPVVTPDVAGYIVWKWMYSLDFGAVNAVLEMLGLPLFGGVARQSTVLPALVIAELWKHVGFYTVIFLTNLALLDPAIDEAAKIDGATTWQRFWHVTIPQLRPAITINSVYALIQFLKTFTVAVVITKGGPSGASNFVSYNAYQKFDQALYGEATAMATTLFIIVIGLAYALYWANERSDWR